MLLAGRCRGLLGMKCRESSIAETGLWQRIFDLFFGYDYFIAHRSVDGKPYAAALYDLLTTRETSSIAFST